MDGFMKGAEDRRTGGWGGVGGVITFLCYCLLEEPDFKRDTLQCRTNAMGSKALYQAQGITRHGHVRNEDGEGHSQQGMLQMCQQHRFASNTDMPATQICQQHRYASNTDDPAT